MASSILFILVPTTFLVVSTTANTTQESIDLVVLTATQAKSQLIEALAEVLPELCRSLRTYGVSFFAVKVHLHVYTV